jgi:hypothetical protein
MERKFVFVVHLPSSLNKLCARAWTGFVWRSLGDSSGVCKRGNELSIPTIKVEFLDWLRQCQFISRRAVLDDIN